MFCSLQTGGQITEHREYISLSVLSCLFHHHPLPGDPIFRGIKQATQPHFSNLLQSLIRGVGELWHEAHVQPLQPCHPFLPCRGCLGSASAPVPPGDPSVSESACEQLFSLLLCQGCRCSTAWHGCCSSTACLACCASCVQGRLRLPGWHGHGTACLGWASYAWWILAAQWKEFHGGLYCSCA